ncbi:hypothetical protein YC2023_070761 [Brassica napus]
MLLYRGGPFVEVLGCQKYQQRGALTSVEMLLIDEHVDGCEARIERTKKAKLYSTLFPTNNSLNRKSKQQVGEKPAPASSPCENSLMYQLCKSMALCHGHGVLTQKMLVYEPAKRISAKKGMEDRDVVYRNFTQTLKSANTCCSPSLLTLESLQTFVALQQANNIISLSQPTTRCLNH